MHTLITSIPFIIYILWEADVNKTNGIFLKVQLACVFYITEVFVTPSKLGAGLKLKCKRHQIRSEMRRAAASNVTALIQDHKIVCCTSCAHSHILGISNIYAHILLTRSDCLTFKTHTSFKWRISDFQVEQKLSGFHGENRSAYGPRYFLQVWSCWNISCEGRTLNSVWAHQVSWDVESQSEGCWDAWGRFHH